MATPEKNAGLRSTSVRRRRLVALVVGVVLVLAAALWLAARPGALAVPTDPNLHYDGRGDYGLLQGTLRASRTGNRACFWVETPTTGRAVSKIPTHRYYLILPTDWSADEALQLLHGFHQPVARPGDRVAFLGAPDAVRRLPGCPVAGVTFYSAATQTP